MFSDTECARLRWRCRRGMLELDAFLIPFFEKHFLSLTDAQKESFRKLLEMEDQSLWRWFLGYEACPDIELQKMISFIKEKHRSLE